MYSDRRGGGGRPLVTETSLVKGSKTHVLVVCAILDNRKAGVSAVGMTEYGKQSKCTFPI